MCWQAGEIIRDRCLDAGENGATCEARAAAARLNAANSSVAAHLTVPGTKIEEWLDAGQCRDCFLPSFGYRPGGSAQYALALSNFLTKTVRQRVLNGASLLPVITTARAPVQDISR